MGRTLLAINNYFYRRGGAEAIFLDQIEMFERAGWRAVPFSMQHPNNLPSPWSSHFIPEIEFGRQSGLLTKIEHSLEVIYSRKARTHLSRLIDQVRPDIAHAHNVYHHMSPSIFPLLKKRGVPTVLTAHDLKLACPAYKMLSPQGICEKCKGGRIHNVLTNRCMKESVALSGLVMVETAVHRTFGLYRNYVDRIIVPSLFYQAKLIEWGWPSEQLIHIPNFVDQSITDNPLVSEEGDYFLFAGRLAPEKGIATLIRATGLSGLRLRIAGTGPDEASLRALAQDVGANVEFLGYLTGGALHAAIAGAKALVLPSEWYENAPVSLLEAYALGRPVIGTDIGGIPELIKDGETGLIARSLDAENLAEVLTTMNSLPKPARQDMGERGRGWVNSEFSQGAYLERTTALYRDLGVR
ncbi:glycosyltransferase involved in cell wall biosynthesis [Rhizobium skierniewicense]|uniref:Glycosyltransferase involved in cell wall biosynthesis n=1 Tax=Rhizobium skierniewicense TaxID=984260 RepID=A0A7W6G072_9HYPH|nr:glycosyltransferase family 4 protein [Rhizobium skierniewicense]MBB3944392.1 glycosyltransferase involved in cell wall biosynthesis [Rhizobium skierniewicense]